MSHISKLPSASSEMFEIYEDAVIRSLDFSNVQLCGKVRDFPHICDVFELSDYVADKLAVIGKEYITEQTGIDRFRVDLFNQIHYDTHIGLLLSCVSKKRKEECFSYGMWADYILMGSSVYCALTVCFVDKDYAYEMPVAVIEINNDQNDGGFKPVLISEDAVEEYFSYFTYDDIAKISTWLRDLWFGIQYEYINRPEIIREVQQIGPISGADENYVERDCELFQQVPLKPDYFI